MTTEQSLWIGKSKINTQCPKLKRNHPFNGWFWLSAKNAVCTLIRRSPVHYVDDWLPLLPSNRTDDHRIQLNSLHLYITKEKLHPHAHGRRFSFFLSQAVRHWQMQKFEIKDDKKLEQGINPFTAVKQKTRLEV